MPEPSVIPAADLDQTSWAFLDDAVGKLERAWRRHHNPGLAEYVPAAGHPLRQRVLLELIKVDQERSWEAGYCRAVEAYLSEWPELGGKADCLLELLEAECLTRAALGKPPDVDEINSRFPEVEARLDMDEILARAEAEKRSRKAELQAEPFVHTISAAWDDTPSDVLVGPVLQVGDRFGRYEIRAVLGQGGMATVYRAYDTQLSRDVALKIPRQELAADTRMLELFVRESRLAAQIEHPNICTVYDAGQVEGQFYLTMRLVEGLSLAGHIVKNPLSPDGAARLIAKVAGALDRVHGRGILHRDIKPSNIMLDGSGEPLLMDFGLARRFDSGSQLTGSGALLGTLPYLAPEQLDGECDVRSDVYSLGVVMYYALTGKLPFQGSPTKLIAQIASSNPAPPRHLRPEMDARLEAICLKALAKRPVERYQSAGELAEALSHYLGRSPAAKRPTARQRSFRWLAVAAAPLLIFTTAIVVLKTGIKPGEALRTSNDREGLPEGQNNPQAARELALTEENLVSLGSVTQWLRPSHFVAPCCVSSDEQFLYTIGGQIAGRWPIHVLDLETGALVREIDFPAVAPGRMDHLGMTLSEDDRYLYVTNYYQQFITRIDLKNRDCLEHILISSMPNEVWAAAIAATPDNQQLVVLLGQDGRSEDLHNDQISVVDIRNGAFRLAGELRLDDELLKPDIGFSADSRFAYVICRPRKSSAPALYEIRLTPPYDVGRKLLFSNGELSGVVASSRHNRVFVSDRTYRKIWVVDLGTFQIAEEIQLYGNAPASLAINCQENAVAVLCPEARKLFCIDPANGTIIGGVSELDKNARDCFFSPHQQRLLVFHEGPDGSIARVDASDLTDRIVFASDRGGESFQLYFTNTAGDKVLRLTNRRATDRSPRWSPDGDQLAFISDQNGPARICVIERDGGEPRVLANTDPVLRPFEGPALDWSPEGREIAFVGGGYSAIRIVNVQSGEIRTVVEGALGRGYSHPRGICWRETEGLILFNSQSASTEFMQDIFQVDPATLEVTQITDTFSGREFVLAPAVSADGARIVAPIQANDKDSRNLALMNRDGSGFVRLTRGDDEWYDNPRWFPDGKRLVCSRRESDQYHLHLVNVEMGKTIPLTRGDWNDVDPDVWGKVLADSSRAR